MKQWLKIELSFNKYEGYKIRTYDDLGTQIFEETVSKAMPPQKVTGPLKIFRSLTGFAKYLKVYKYSYDLPFEQPTHDGYCIVNYSF